MRDMLLLTYAVCNRDLCHEYPILLVIIISMIAFYLNIVSLYGDMYAISINKVNFAKVVCNIKHCL